MLLALSIIIIPQFYITGDGPSHTYNAKVLFDMIQQHNREFYDFYYKINRQLIDPNWTSHLLIGFFSRLLPYWMADKLFQIIYVLVFCFGFRYLIRAIKNENTFLSFLFFPFLFTLTFQQGFYNYVLGVALLFWCIGYYIRIQQELDNPIHQITLCLLLLSVSLAHGMAAVYTMLLLGLIWVFAHAKKIKQLDIRSLYPQMLRLLLVCLPSILMIGMFMLKRGFSTSPHPKGVDELFIDFITMSTSQSTRNVEVIPAVMSLLLILSYIVLHVFKKRRKAPYRSSNNQSSFLSIVFLIFAGYTLFSYLTSPGTISATGSIEIRIAFLPPLFLLLFLATKNWSSFSKSFFILASGALSIFFLAVRFPSILQANTVAKEIMMGADYIKDESVVLNLHYDDWQITSKGDSIFQRDNSFIHFTDYYGAIKNKHLVMLFNYEANKNYFPINWKVRKSPLKFMRKMYSGYYPPCGSFDKYETHIDKKIDYVILQNWRDAFMKQKCTQDLLAEMKAAGFTKKYTSPNQYVVIWER